MSKDFPLNEPKKFTEAEVQAIMEVIDALKVAVERMLKEQKRLTRAIQAKKRRNP